MWYSKPCHYLPRSSPEEDGTHSATFYIIQNLDKARLGWAGLGWAGLAGNLRTGRVKSNHQSKCCKHLSTPITFHKIRFPSIHHLPSSCHSCSSYQSCCLYHPSYCSLTQILFFLRISQFQFSVFILREKMLWPHHEMYFIMLPSAGWVAASWQL